MKKYSLFLLLFVFNASANPYDDFGYVSAEYIGTCYGLDYLKNRYCKSIVSYSPQICIDAVLKITPDNVKNDLRNEILSNREIFIRNTASGIDNGIKKIMDLSKNDTEKSCLVYSSSLITKNNQLFEELKRIRHYLK